jgi:hypothetical protein
MTHEEFLELLKKANLNKKEFVDITRLAYSTVGNWSSSDKVPYWVNSWLENYIERKKHSKLVEVLKESGVCGE